MRAASLTPKDAPDYWPTTERSIANVGAAFPEAIIRTLFGFQPRWHQPAAGREPAAKARAVEQQLLLPKVARPFVGRLANLRTAHGLVNITSSAQGLAVTAAAESASGSSRALKTDDRWAFSEDRFPSV